MLRGFGSFRIKLHRPNPLILSFSPNSASKTRVNALIGRWDAARARCNSADPTLALPNPALAGNIRHVALT
jgi:hypothetical protein